jgi:cysteinyl-tRNA synthetase
MPACWWCSTWWRAGCAQAGYAVTYVRNITDIDDKIIKRALENKETIRR